MQTYYLSPTGQDSAPGTMDRPWASPGRALEALAGLARKSPVRVVMRGGFYGLGEPLTLRPEHGGTEQAPVTFAAFPGERPILSGGAKVSGWEVTKIHGQDGWRAHLSDVAAGSWHFTQLFVNGQRAPRTRLPETGWYHFAGSPGGKQLYTWYQGPRQAFYEPGHFDPAWQNPGDMTLVMLNRWYDQHLHLDKVDAAQRLLTFTCNTLDGVYDERGEGCRYAVENVFEAMNKPGQWYLDRPTGWLYYLPKQGQTPENTTIIAPRWRTLVALHGQPDRPVSHVRFEGLSFEHAEWETPLENPGSIQAAFIVPASVKLRNAHHCAFHACTFTRSAGYGIEVQPRCTDNRIIACTFTDLGAGGIKIEHEHGQQEQSWSKEAFAGIDASEIAARRDPGEEGPQPFPARTEVADCHIHHCGKIYPGCIGIWIGDAGFNHVHHNHIHDLFYTGISCGWNWTYGPTRTVGNRIEFNHVHGIGKGELSDMGTIYLLGRQPGAIVRGNHVYDVSCYGYGASGIYPDQGSSYLLIEDNIVHHTQSECLSIHYAAGLRVRNNLFALTQAGLITRGREESALVALIERNILLNATGRFTHGCMYPDTLEIRNNLYWSDDGTPLMFAGMSWDQWRQAGRDAGSIIANPLLSDPHGMGFALRSDSPALTMGIKPLSIHDAGPRHPRTLPASIDDLPPAANPPRPMLEPLLYLADEAGAMEKLPLSPSSHPATQFIHFDRPQPVTLVMTNRGDAPASGRLRFEVSHPERASILGPSSFDYHLRPGERGVWGSNMKMQGADPVRIAVWDEADVMPPMGWVVCSRREVSIRRITAITDVSGVSRALADQPRYALKLRDTQGPELVMAMAGDRLAIHLRVTDAQFKPTPQMPWWGSSVEYFLRSDKALNGFQQFFLIPGDESTPAASLRMNQRTGTLEAEPATQVVSTRTADGYTLWALVDASLLAIKPGEASFTFDIHVKTTPPGGSTLELFRLYQGVMSWMGMDGWGDVLIN